MQTTFYFDGKEFKLPQRIENERTIALMDIDEEAKPRAWYLNRETLPKVMRLILDGPHDEIDWLKQDAQETMKAYRDFFQHYAQKISASENS